MSSPLPDTVHVSPACVALPAIAVLPTSPDIQVCACADRAATEHNNTHTPTMSFLHIAATLLFRRTDGREIRRVARYEHCAYPPLAFSFGVLTSHFSVRHRSGSRGDALARFSTDAR